MVEAPPSRSAHPGLRIREAQADEHGSIGLLAGEAFARFGDYAAPIGRWLSTPGAQAMIALRGEELLGFALVALFVQPGQAGLRGEVLAIAVAQTARGLGIGSTLLGRSIDALRGSGHMPGCIEADIARDNAPALALFGAHGFVAVGLGAAYAHGERAVRVRL